MAQNMEQWSNSDCGRFTPNEWMLVLLGADDAKPILGKTVFVKELFVIGKESIADIDDEFEFFPSRYGPYSRHFQPALDSLVREGLVIEKLCAGMTGEKSRQSRMEYVLTPAGKTVANSLIDRLPEETKLKIHKSKRILSSMGTWGIINYVYSNYPEYAVLSELIGRRREPFVKY